MSHVKVPDIDEGYFYAPSIVLSCLIDYCGKDADTVYIASGEGLYADRVVPLPALSAVDGSVITLYNE